MVGDPIPKLYFYPIAKGLPTIESTDDIFIASLARLDLNIMPTLTTIQAFIAEAKARDSNHPIRFETLFWDAVEPSRTRLKLYMRTLHTSLRTTEEIFTLGGGASTTIVREQV